jgi:hypothetical protein
MVQQVINIGEVANDGTGEALRDAFQAVNDNFSEVYTAGPVGSNIQIANNTITTTVVNQNLVLRPNGIGNIQANAAILPGIDGVYDIGTVNQRFDSVHAVYFYGNGVGLTGVTSTGIANGTTSISAAQNGNITFDISGTPNVVVFSPNVTTYSSNLSATGNITGNYILGNGALLTGVITSVANINSGNSNVSISTPGGNVTVAVNGTANVATFTPNSLQVVGNVVASNFIGNITGNLTVAGTNSGVLFNDAGVANAVPGLLFNKLSSNLTASGNIAGNYFVGNGVAILGVLADRGGDSNNWDALIEMGVYTVNRTSWAGVTGAPLDSQIFVGLLEIKNSTSSAIEQIFYPGQVTSDVKMQWNRARWNGVWTSWVKMVNDGQVVVGGEF